MELNARWDQFSTLHRIHLRYWLKLVHSPATVEAAETWLHNHSAFKDLSKEWDGMSPAQREEAAETLNRIFRQAAYATRPFCLRCGACCDKSGPTLYQGDESLVWSGLDAVERDGARPLSWRHLRTFRRGEEVFSHYEERRQTLQHECVIVAPAQAGGCPHHARHGCAIYDHRPTQCKAQKCWDTAASAKLVAGPGLTRLHLLPPEDPLREIIREHDERCDLRRMGQLVEDFLKSAARDCAEGIRRMLRSEFDLRQEVAALDRRYGQAMPFLLGRPLQELLGQQGVIASRGQAEDISLRRALPRPQGGTGP